MTGPRSRRIAIAGGYRNILEWGEPGRPAVVLQHGMRDHAFSWRWVAEHLAPSFHVIAPDLRGHGDSDWSTDRNYTLPAFVQDLSQVIDIMRLSACNLVGHSLGGQIVLRYAASYPEIVRAIVVIEGVELPIIRNERQNSIPYPARLREWIDNQAMARHRRPRFYNSPVEAADRMAQAHPNIDRETVDYLALNGIVAEIDRGFRWKYDDSCRYRAPDDQRGSDLDDIVAAVACPALLAYGEDSWIAPPPSERLARFRQFKVVRFAEASHWLHHQQRRQFNEMTQAFLDDPGRYLNSEIERYA